MQLVASYTSAFVLFNGATGLVTDNHEVFWFKYLGNAYTFRIKEFEKCQLCGTKLRFNPTTLYAVVACSCCNFEYVVRISMLAGTYANPVFEVTGVQIYDTTLPYLLAYEPTANVTG